MFMILSTLFMLGIDTVGGVRVPAGFCGILGFRPSHGTVSHKGIIPVSSSLDTVGMDDTIISPLCQQNCLFHFEKNCFFWLIIDYNVEFMLDLSLSLSLLNIMRENNFSLIFVVPKR